MTPITNEALNGLFLFMPSELPVCYSYLAGKQHQLAHPKCCVLGCGLRAALPGPDGALPCCLTHASHGAWSNGVELGREYAEKVQPWLFETLN